MAHTYIQLQYQQHTHNHTTTVSTAHTHIYIHTITVSTAHTHMYIQRTQNHFNKMKTEVGMLLPKSTDTRGVVISSMRKSIYLLKTTPSSHTHRFHPLPLATPTSCSPHPYIPPTLHNRPFPARGKYAQNSISGRSNYFRYVWGKKSDVMLRVYT